MAKTNVTQAAPAAPVKSLAPEAQIVELRECIRQTDSFCQAASRSISAATASILLLLREPDSPSMRLNIKALCDVIGYQADDCMNTVNWHAEQHDADYIDELRNAADRLICSAVRGTAQRSQEVQS